ncbi:MAG: glycoside hydrolase family 2 TIM barrel-domain containing protein [Endomicrobiales bacterium]
MFHKFPLAMALIAGIGSGVQLGAAAFQLNDPGTEAIIDYEKYGAFEGTGTDKYEYRVTDSAGLKKAAGEGVYPNTAAVLHDPGYKQAKAGGKLEGKAWDFVNSGDHQANFYKWATAQEENGVRQYYTALALERSGNFAQAIKAYYAIVVHFPRSAGQTYWKTPWYVGPAAIGKIQFLTREHPELGLKLVGAQIKVKDGFSTEKSDSFAVTPGKLVAVRPEDVKKIPRVDVGTLRAVRSIGNGSVKLVEYENRHWQLTVNGKPFVVRAVAYSPNRVGLSPDKGTLDVTRTWMFDDFNNNGRIDGPYDAWADGNRNNVQDADEKPVGDFKLMKDMGVNTIRLYHHEKLNKQLLREGHDDFGFMYLMGDYFGMYARGSGAEWFEGTDYTNPTHRANMLASVRRMVEEYRDEPCILMWVLGNENNYGTPGEKGKTAGTGSRAKLQPDAYYAFVNEAARLIKSLDPQKRPVAVCNGDLLFLDKCAGRAPDVDVFGANAYRGEQGFGTLWQDVADVYGKPVLITEFGCSAFKQGGVPEESEQGQARYHRGNWRDIESNLAGAGAGNALGGVVFEWTDEWWKAGPDSDPSKHDEAPQFGAPFLDEWSYEEWLGIASQGNATDSPFQRQLRPVYYEYQKMWNN